MDNPPPDTPVDRHPWRRFLRARQAAIVWLSAAGEPDERIAVAMSLTAAQVSRIRASTAAEDRGVANG